MMMSHQPMPMVLSQEDLRTPRDVEGIAPVVSPQRKKRTRFFPTGLFNSSFSSSQSSTNVLASNFNGISDSNGEFGSIFMFSQDSIMSTSQLSQDAGRLGDQLHVVNHDSNSFQGGGNVFSIALPESTRTNSNDGSNNPNDNFKMPFVPFSQYRSQQTKTPAQDLPETERQIALGPPIVNQFLPVPASSNSRRSSTLWVSPFREWPRFLVDFEQEGTIGESTFSYVFCARRRLDGVLYAIKKLKTKITSESEGRRLTKEICALAALQGCPNIVQYFSSWVDSQNIYIQTEYCSVGTLDVFVPKDPPPAQGRSGGSSPVSLFSSKQAYTRGRSSSWAAQQGESAENSSTLFGTVALPATESNDTSSGDRLFDETIARVILRQLLTAISFMHERDMAHLDIRPANVFISATRPTNSFNSPRSSTNLPNPTEIAHCLLRGDCVLKLGDFGHTCSTYTPLCDVEEGDSRYCCRELIHGVGKVDYCQADMFSLGVSMYELCLGRALDHSGLEGSFQWHQIRDGILDPAFLSSATFSEGWIELIAQLLHSDPELRPRSSDLLDRCFSVNSAALEGTKEREN